MFPIALQLIFMWRQSETSADLRRNCRVLSALREWPLGTQGVDRRGHAIQLTQTTAAPSRMRAAEFFMDVVIVESPAKAKTINKYLGPGYEVLASYGHVRDLPAKDGSVRPDDDFSMDWEVDPKSSKRLSDIASAVKRAERVILATDPDREGEAISWHVLQVLRAKNVLRDKQVDRVVFNAVTRQAVQEAMRNPRAIDEPLVDAYLARRALDYLVGFTLSPVLWRKLPGARSAGRVQSVALRLVCDREAEIERFRPQEYWSVIAHLRTLRNDPFTARLVVLDGKKLDRLAIGAAGDANAAKRRLENSTFTVASVESKPQRRNPPPPFITSTLQQEAQRKLGFDASHTMRVAQRLYEGVDIGGDTVGLITYMRTDGFDLAPEALTATRRVIDRDYGARYLPDVPRRYTSRVKNAQEAHEAIRPTDLSRLPGDVARFLDTDQRRLYELIWKRTIASQMESAELERTTIDIDARSPEGSAQLRATGTVIRFDGFLTLYQEGRDDEDDEESGRLPAMTAGERVERERIEANQHFTEPPPATPRPRSSRRWRSSASGDHPPTRRPWRRSASANMCASSASAWCPRTRVASSPPISRISSSATWSSTSRPSSRRSSIASPPASFRGRTCCVISGATSRPTSRRPTR